MSVNRNLPLYTAEWIYRFTGLRLINYIPFYWYIYTPQFMCKAGGPITHSKRAKRVNITSQSGRLYCNR